MNDVVDRVSRKVRLFELLSKKKLPKLDSIDRYLIECRTSAVRSYSLFTKNYALIVRDARFEEYLVHFADAMCVEEEKFKRHYIDEVSALLKNFCLEILFNKDSKWAVAIWYTSIFRKEGKENYFLQSKLGQIYRHDRYPRLELFADILRLWVVNHETNHIQVHALEDKWDYLSIHSSYIKKLSTIAWPYLDKKDDTIICRVSCVFLNFLCLKIQDNRYRLWVEEVECDLMAIEVIVDELTKKYYSSQVDRSSLINLAEKTFAVINSIHFIEYFRIRIMTQQEPPWEKNDDEQSVFSVRKSALILWFVAFAKEKNIIFRATDIEVFDGFFQKQLAYWLSLVELEGYLPSIFESLLKMSQDVMRGQAMTEDICIELVKSAWVMRNIEGKLLESKEVEVKDKDQSCSFCGLAKDKVNKLIAGSSVYICDGCLEMCNEIIATECAEETASKLTKSYTTPRDIFDYLSTYVVAQESAKKAISVSVFYHLLERTFAGKSKSRKENILIIGPSGTGKTYLVSRLAIALNIPFVVVSATAYTEAGYVGEDIESMVSYLLQACNYQVEKAERGIIFIDEVDSLARKKPTPFHRERDVSGVGVQHALLPMLDGTVIHVPGKGGRKHPKDDFIKINTRGITFILAGTFVGIESIIEDRLSLSGQANTGITDEEKIEIQQRSDWLRQKASSSDFTRYGMITEFVDRMDAFVFFDHLTKHDLAKILIEGENAVLKEYISYFHDNDIDLVFEEEAVIAIAQQALEHGAGARGLRLVVSRFLNDALFDLPEWNGVSKCVITEDVVLKKERPQLFQSDGNSVAPLPGKPN